MVDAIVNGDFVEVEGTNPLEASGVDAEQIWVGATLVMRVYAAL
jgi:hypothetical protein